LSEVGGARQQLRNNLVVYAGGEGPKSKRKYVAFCGIWEVEPERETDRIRLRGGGITWWRDFSHRNLTRAASKIGERTQELAVSEQPLTKAKAKAKAKATS
jgi:hypothetical protein